MAIIKPSRKFVGSEMDSGAGGKYIRPDIKQVLFNKNNNKDGTYLYFLPAYKVDGAGGGVWFKVINVRDNFGDKFKDKYVTIENDPVAHFERNFKLHYPEEALVVDETNEKTGRTQKRYPNFGRVTRRVVFNVAYSQELEKGAHVLDLPAYNGANILMKWLETKDNRGRERPMLNDPERAIPVFIKLNDGGGAPWELSPDPTDPGVLPEQLADTDYIYNLDNIFVKKTAVELIAKLKEMYTTEVFEQCMEGYPGFGGQGGVKATAASNPTAKAEANDAPAPKATKAAPSLKNIPKVNTKKADTAPEPADEVDVTPSVLESNPLAGISTEEAAEFLRK
jgi:hypothetical protein